MKNSKTKMLVFLALLTALEIVLSRFASINAWNLKIGFSFVPIAVAAIFFGPIAGGIVGALGDFLGAILFPIGPYFPGFTLTAFLTGLLFGILLHKKQTFVRTAAAVLINQLVFGLVLNTFWISLLYTSPYFPLMGTRLAQCAILIPVQGAALLLMPKVTERIGKQVPHDR